MKVVCSNCNREFIPKELKESYLGAMITSVYIKCPHCKKEHLVMVKTAKARHLMNALQGLKNQNTLESLTLTGIVKKDLKVELDKYNRGV